MIRILLKIKESISKFIDKIHSGKQKYGMAFRYNRDAKKRLKLIGGGYNGSKKEYREKVLKYWERYGIKPQKFWYDLYCNGKNQYEPRFIPNTIWEIHILPYFNCLKMRDAYTDKGILKRLLTNVRQPETIVKNIAGYYYNGDREQIITMEEAVNLCRNEKDIIVKPSRGSKGEGIVFYDKNIQDIGAVFDTIGTEFVVQRVIKQHSVLSSLNRDSLNTIRVISFHFKNTVHILSAQLRIGGKGAKVDNVSSGGSACPINSDGSLYPKAVNRKSEWIDTSPSGIKYRDVRIPNYLELIDTAKQLHLLLPYFNIVGWDFAIGEDSHPILIEFNVRTEQNQIGCGQPTFGNLTDEVLEDVFIKKSLKGIFNSIKNEK